MNIIPAIDIKGGMVVRAMGGNRKYYQPVHISLNQSSDPIVFTRRIIQLYHPSVIYLADLDSLNNDGDNTNIIIELCNLFKNIIFWVDVGNRKISSLEKNNIIHVMCSECLKKIKNFNYIYKNHIYSYDYKDGIIGFKYFQKLDSKYKNKIILMNMSDVGTSKGPDYKHIKRTCRSSKKEYYVAGGINSVFDIIRLRNMKVNGVIVSSILFNTKTNKYLIKKRASS